MDYNKETRTAYTSDKAKSYKLQQTKGISWIRFTTWREKSHVANSLAICNLAENSRIIDLPCGTAIMSEVFRSFPLRIFACDISQDMMLLAKEEYDESSFGGFIQSDIIHSPFKPAVFDCSISIGIMHRLPADIRRQALHEIILISKEFIIVSYSIDSFVQRFKRWLMKRVFPYYKPAPSLISLHELMKEFALAGLKVIKRYNVMPFFSAEVVFLLKKDRTL